MSGCGTASRSCLTRKAGRRTSSVPGRTSQTASAPKSDLKRLAEKVERHNRFICETFGRYLTDEVVATVLESPTGLKMGGEKRKITMVMADLRGFTSLSQRLPPERVVTLLNRYLTTMVSIIKQYQGTIDEFIGDAIFVLFGAPIW